MIRLTLLKDYFDYEEYTAAGKGRSGEIYKKLMRIIPEKEMATHSSFLAWRIPWIEETGRLHSMGLQRVRHDLATNVFFHFSWLWEGHHSARKFYL